MTDRHERRGETENKIKKQRGRASGGAYYTAVTPPPVRQSTHYSCDLGGQLEESSINQTDARAEADDGSDAYNPPPIYPHQTVTHPPINTSKPCTTFICILPLPSFILSVSPFRFYSSHSFRLSFFFSHHPSPSSSRALSLPRLSGYKQ